MIPLVGIEIEREPDAVIVRLSGEIDVSNAVDLRSTLRTAVPKTALGLVLDLSRTSYIDSSGVGLIFDLRGRLAATRRELRLVVPLAAPIEKVLKLTRVSWTIPQHATVAEALAGLRRQGWRSPGPTPGVGFGGPGPRA